MSRDTSGGGLWPDDDGEINILTNILACGRKVMMMFLMRLPLQTRYAILTEGCSCPTMPDDDEDVFLDSPRLVRAVISLIEYQRAERGSRRG